MTPKKMFSVAKIPLIISAITLTLSSLNANAALYDRGNGMIYDSTQNITWLQDANYAKTSGYDADGRMAWQQSTNWTANLVYGGFSDWRLSSAGVTGNNAFSYNGSTDRGYNNAHSEIGHLYLELGNAAQYSGPSGQGPTQWGFNNLTFVDAATHKNVSFVGVDYAFFWELETYALQACCAWGFRASTGEHTYSNIVNETRAWAVRDGDVAAVPVPAAAWLMGSGLIGLAGIARRKK